MIETHKERSEDFLSGISRTQRIIAELRQAEQENRRIPPDERTIDITTIKEARKQLEALRDFLIETGGFMNAGGEIYTYRDGDMGVIKMDPPDRHNHIR